MRVFTITTLIIYMICSISCSSIAIFRKPYIVPPKPVQVSAPDFSENIYKRTKEISNSSTKLDVNNGKLNILLDGLKTAESKEVRDKVLTEIASIVESNTINIDKLEENVKPLVDIAYELNYLNKYIKEIEEQNGKILLENTELRKNIKGLNDKIYNLESEGQAWYQKLWIGLAFLGLLGIVFGAVTIKTAPKTGASLIGGSIVIISLSYFAQQYAWIIMIIGGVGVFTFIGIFVYNLFIHKKTIQEKEIITHKINNKEEFKEEEFLSKSTQKIINKEKKQLIKKGIIKDEL